MTAKKRDLYCQCIIEYRDKSTEVSWIPIKFARDKKQLIIGKNKSRGKRAMVKHAFRSIQLTEDEITINYRNPLKNVTDI